MSDDFSDDFRKPGHMGGVEDVGVERPPADLAAIYDRLARDSAGWARRLSAATPLQEYLRALSKEVVPVDAAVPPRSGAAAVRHEQLDLSDEPPRGAAPDGRLSVPSAHPGRRAVWGGALSAVAIVALLAATFVLLSRAPGTTQRTVTTSPHASSCPPNQITLMLPAHTGLYQLDMTSPTDGWALGYSMLQGLLGDQRHPFLVRFHQCQWAPVPNLLAGDAAVLANISMDTAADGWVAGWEENGTSSRCVLLHYTGGKWQRAALPPQVQGQKVSTCVQIRMYAPDEGWLLASWEAPGDGGIQSVHLLHYVNGVWTLVEYPISGLFDLETTGRGDVWVVGSRPPAQTDPNRFTRIDLAHDVQGHWTTFHLAVGADAWLRMNSPSDGWLVSVPEPNQVLHYDGTTWQQAPVSNLLTANSEISVFDASDMWIITYRWGQWGQQPYAPVTGMQHDVGGQWQTATWPFPDVGVFTPLTRAAPGDYWAIGIHEDGTDQSTLKGVLLQYVGGSWHEYGA